MWSLKVIHRLGRRTCFSSRLTCTCAMKSDAAATDDPNNGLFACTAFNDPMSPPISRNPIHVQTAFHEVMGGEQTKGANYVCKIARLRSTLDGFESDAQCLVSSEALPGFRCTLRRKPQFVLVYLAIRSSRTSREASSLNPCSFKASSTRLMS